MTAASTVRTVPLLEDAPLSSLLEAIAYAHRRLDEMEQRVYMHSAGGLLRSEDLGVLLNLAEQRTVVERWASDPDVFATAVQEETRRRELAAAALRREAALSEAEQRQRQERADRERQAREAERQRRAELEQQVRNLEAQLAAAELQEAARKEQEEQRAALEQQVSELEAQLVAARRRESQLVDQLSAITLERAAKREQQKRAEQAQEAAARARSDARGQLAARQGRNECACSTIEVLEVENRWALPTRLRSQVEGTTLRPSCGQRTNGMWAPGHDGRAVGVLRAAHRAGLPVRVGARTGSAIDVTRALWPGLLAKVMQ